MENDRYSKGKRWGIFMDYRVLIVDDEIELADSTAEYFNMFELPTKAVYTGEEAKRFFEENTCQLILLDINLGDASGFELCKYFRQTLDLPILFISARSTDDDMVIALNIGGDDYITKPYSLSVLYAKVKAVLKRYFRTGEREKEDLALEDGSGVIRVGNVSINGKTGIVLRDNREVILTAMEYKLLFYLAERAGAVVSKQEIFENVWEDSFVSDGTLNVHVRHLREKLEDDPNHPKILKTVRGIGLSFRNGQI